MATLLKSFSRRSPPTSALASSPLLSWSRHFSDLPLGSKSSITAAIAERASAWWDLENCQLPSDLDETGAAGVPGAIEAAFKSVGIRLEHPLLITAYGNMVQVSRAHQTALAKAGVHLMHVAPGGKDNADRHLHDGLRDWVSQNPPPAHVLLISGDRDFARMLHFLRVEQYNVLLASRGIVHSILSNNAVVMWDWDSLVRGEKLSARYCRQPPDLTWYGHHEGPLWDHFSVIERPEYFWNESECKDQVSQDDFWKRMNTVTKRDISQDDFWRLLKSFLNSDLGSLVIAESRTRGNLAYYIWKNRPPFLKSITKNDAILLVDLLISEGWVQQSPHLLIPFSVCNWGVQGRTQR